MKYNICICSTDERFIKETHDVLRNDFNVLYIDEFVYGKLKM